MAVLDLPEGEFFRQGNLTLTFSWQRAEWVDSLYEDVVWGTEGLRYRFLDVSALMNVYPDGGWVHFTRSGEPIGAYLLVPRARSWNEERIPSVYRTFLAMKPGMAGRSLGRILTTETRRFVDEHLHRGIVFGFIEHENLASLAVARHAGYRPIAEAVTDNYAATRPRHVEGLRRMRDEERDGFVERLHRLYAGHQLEDFVESVNPAFCWVLERNGQWVAAVQAEPRRLELTDLGYGGWLERALPFVPVLRRLVDPKDYRFLWYQHLWFREAEPAASYELLEGVLHATSHHLANLQFDPQSPAYRAWRRAGRLGPLAVFRHRFSVMAELRDVEPPAGPFVYTSSGA